MLVDNIDHNQNSIPNVLGNILRDPIKLVIWDLDETFWKGTLSEGGAELVAENVEIVHTLNSRGIINAICSKNDLATVKARLESDGLWDSFVFRRIAWQPKGEAVARIIEDMQLRAPNVLFIDDNIGNLREAEHYAPGLQTAMPDILPSLLTMPQLKGKSDPDLTRLQQYRQLEEKFLDRAQHAASNEEFLRECRIQVDIHSDIAAEFDRVHELILRTNQLNFTKRRLQRSDLENLIADPNYQCAYISVKDKYGEYGICGFYSLYNGELCDFLFSCRTLNMGVEQWVYQKIGSPQLTVVGEVVADVHNQPAVDWINLAVETSDSSASSAPQFHNDARVLIKGGCDLIQVNDFLGGRLETDLSYTNNNGDYVEAHHIEFIKGVADGTYQNNIDILENIVFYRKNDIADNFVEKCKSENYSHIAFSLLNEYGQGLYKHKLTNLVLPYGQYYRPITDTTYWEQIDQPGLKPAFLQWFQDNFEFIGSVDGPRLQADIRWLRSVIPAKTRLIFINGAEVDLGERQMPDRVGLHLHQRELNRALDEVVATLDNCSICDVRQFMTSEHDVTFDTRHYTRSAALKLAEALASAISADVKVIERGPIAMLTRKVLRKLGKIVTVG